MDSGVTMIDKIYIRNKYIKKLLILISIFISIMLLIIVIAFHIAKFYHEKEFNKSKKDYPSLYKQYLKDLYEYKKSRS